MTKKQNTAQQPENQDFIASFLMGIVNFCKKNKQGVITAAVILVVAAIIGSSYSAYQNKVAEDSWAAYYTAQVVMSTQGEQAGFKHLDDLAAKYKGTPAAQYAMLLKADVFYANENFAQAAEVYNLLADSKNETVYTAANLSRSAALQAAGEYHVAADGMNEFIKNNPNSFALPQAYLTLAMSQELAGKKEEALAAYKYLLENHTKSYFGTLAKEKIEQLNK
jgi:tetratricopeptide (TPR) repeat protein